MLRKKKNKAETELQGALEKYDTEMMAKQADIDNNREQCVSC